jgi:hypothetical protein
MRTTMCFILVLVVVGLSNAQFRNVRIPIDTEWTQLQPSVAVSPHPDYEWFIAAVWTHIPSLPRHNVGHAVSTDRGLTWVFNDTSILNGGFPAIAFDIYDGGPGPTSLHCVYAEVNPSNGVFGRIYHTLTEEFLEWRPPRQVSISTNGQRDPKIAIDNVSGRVYVTWWEWSGDAFQTRIFFRHSTNRGSSWLTQIELAAATAEKPANLDVSPFYLGEGAILVSPESSTRT